MFGLLHKEPIFSIEDTLHASLFAVRTDFS